MSWNQTIYYAVKRCDNTSIASPYALEISGHFCITRPVEQEVIAEQCADDFYWNHDGHEHKWPLKIVLFEFLQGQVLNEFIVDIELEPTFTAYKGE